MHKNPLPNSLYHSRVKPRRPDIRGDYFRDQTAIIHATPFRRLKHKTQVFFSPQNDHICTRIEHVLHVSTIATTICKGLGLDVELAQAIALGHDLGHAPFGHAGEKILDTLSADSGGFIHEVHGLRVVDKLTRNGEGLNLTYAVRDGIVSHCGEKFAPSIQPATEEKDLSAIDVRQIAPLTFEGCVVRIADIIAYLGRDIEDAIAAGLITLNDVPANLKKSLGSTNGEIIDTLVLDVVRASDNTDIIMFSEQKYDLLKQLKEFNYTKIYNHPHIAQSDAAIRNLITSLFETLTLFFRKHHFDLVAYDTSPLTVIGHFGTALGKRQAFYASEKNPERAVVDFIAGMTDSYALDMARELLFPNPVGREELR